MLMQGVMREGRCVKVTREVQFRRGRFSCGGQESNRVKDQGWGAPGAPGVPGPGGTSRSPGLSARTSI